MPLNRLHLASNAEADAEIEQTLTEVHEQLGLIEQELESFKAPGTAFFLQKLELMESSALEALVSGPPEVVTPMRERVKVIRALLNTPRELERERQRLQGVLRTYSQEEQ